MTLRQDILAALRARGATISTLVTRTGMLAASVEDELVKLRAEGLVACADKLWYRKDIPVKPPNPRRPVVTAKMAKFLKRQGNLF